jgi:hypothetical protein
VRPLRRRCRAGPRDRAAAAGAEGEIVAGDDARSADALRQQAGDELFRRSAGKRAVELEHQHCIGAGMFEQALALVEGGEAEGGGVRLEVADGVRVEGGNDDRAAFVMPACDGAADHGLVAEVKAVEIAERDDAPAQFVRKAGSEA